MFNFGEHLKTIRQSKNLTQKQLAELIGSTERGIQRYESVERKPNFDAILALCNALNVSADYLIGRTDTPTPVPQTAQSAETEIQTEFNKLTESEQKDVLDYIRFKKHRRPEAKGLKELDAEIMEQNISRAAFTPSVPDFTDENEEFMNKKNSPSKD